MKLSTLIFSSVMLFGITVFAQKQQETPTMKIGDIAPALVNYELLNIPSDLAKSKTEASKDFNKNGKIEFKKGTVYVVEFWATWCPPCLKAFPHLSALQKKYGDKVIIIGVSIDQANAKARAKEFAKDPAKDMNYRVIWDQKSVNATNYCKAFQIRGIPAAFIIDKEGKIAWGGHPGMMDAALEKAVKE